MKLANLELPQAEIEDFCRRWKIKKLELFGSALRDDFTDESDIDLLVSFLPESEHGLFEHAQMEEELEELFHRRVDLVSRQAIEEADNPFRKRTILNSTLLVYERT